MSLSSVQARCLKEEFRGVKAIIRHIPEWPVTNISTVGHVAYYMHLIIAYYLCCIHEEKKVAVYIFDLKDLKW